MRQPDFIPSPEGEMSGASWSDERSGDCGDKCHSKLHSENSKIQQIQIQTVADGWV